MKKEEGGTIMSIFAKKQDSEQKADQKVTGADGKVLVYMDISFRNITPKTYEILRAGLLKK